MDPDKECGLRDLELAKAARDGDVAAMEWLISTLHCDPNVASHIGAPLVLAAYHGRFEAVEFLLRTANLDVDVTDLSVNGGSCALHAVSGLPDRRAILRRLLESGADANSRNSEGRTPLMIAAQWGNTHGVQEILKYGSYIDIEAIDHFGKTASMIAQERGHEEIVTLLDSEVAAATAAASNLSSSSSSVATCSALSLFDADSKILEELECPVCLDEMRPPKRIFSCSNAHLFCGRCNVLELKTCPKCREDFKNARPVRNRLAERWAHKIFS